MQITVFDKAEPKVVEPVRLKLKQRGNNVQVVAVNIYGDVMPGGYIATISESGIAAHSSLNSSLGFEQDSDGCVLLRTA